MTQEQLDRLDYLANKGSWKMEEFQELTRLQELFYKTFRAYVPDLRTMDDGGCPCKNCGSSDFCLC
jgi:hypothetical protein